MAKSASEAIEESRMTDDELQAKEKLSYVETQLEEMQRISWRNEVDIYINKNSPWTADEQPEVDGKVRQLEKQNDNLAKAMSALTKLKKELE